MMSRENFHQCLAALNVLCSIFMMGVNTNWVSAVIPKLRSGEDGLKANDDQIAWIVSLSETGRFMGPIVTAIILDKIGRRSTILLCSFLFFILWSIMTFARTITLIYCLRIMLGVIHGVIDVTSPIYLAENCTPKMRGIMISIMPLCHTTAFTVEYILAAWGSYTFVAAVNAVISFAALSTSFFLKETPYYLLMKGSEEAAKKNLLWLRGKASIDSDIKLEMEKIQQNMQSEIMKKRSLVSLLGSPENLKPLRLAAIFSFMIPALGILMVFAYSSMIFKPTSLFSVNRIAIIFGVIQLISACVAPFIIERFNRRPLLMITLSIVGICHLCTFILFKLKISEEYFAWLIFATITLFSVIFTLTYSIMAAIRTELLPTSVRAVGGSLNIMTSAIACSILLRLFIPISQAFGMGYNFLLYATACFLECILVLIIIPETRGKSLVDIQMSFVSNK